MGIKGGFKKHELDGLSESTIHGIITAFFDFLFDRQDLENFGIDEMRSKSSGTDRNAGYCFS